MVAGGFGLKLFAVSSSCLLSMAFKVAFSYGDFESLVGCLSCDPLCLSLKDIVVSFSRFLASLPTVESSSGNAAFCWESRPGLSVRIGVVRLDLAPKLR